MNLVLLSLVELAASVCMVRQMYTATMIKEERWADFYFLKSLPSAGHDRTFFQMPQHSYLQEAAMGVLNVDMTLRICFTVTSFRTCSKPCSRQDISMSMSQI